MVGSGSFDADSVLPDATRYGNESGAYNYGAQAAQVHVDPETGQVTVLSFVVASDCGTVIYPIGAEGQVEGGLAQGIGYALTEGLQIDEGRPINPNFSDYRIPSMRDMPPLQHAFADSYEPTGPFGAKGLGELNMDPIAAVINNAIFDACRRADQELTDHAGKDSSRSARERERKVGRTPVSANQKEFHHKGREETKFGV